MSLLQNLLFQRPHSTIQRNTVLTHTLTKVYFENQMDFYNMESNLFATSCNIWDSLP